MKKQVVFNALQTSLNGGIGRYCIELVREMYKNKDVDLKIVIRDQDIDKFSFVDKEDLLIIKGINNSSERNKFEQFKLPKIIYKAYPNALVHYPDSIIPIFTKNPTIITVHDLAFKSVKNTLTTSSKIWKNFIASIAMRKSLKIIAITSFTESEVSKYYNQFMNKVNVIYNGFNDFSIERYNENYIRKELKELKDDYILTVSTISPRKNIDGLIQAFNKIKDKTNMNLVIAGANGWDYEKIYECVERLNIKDRVIFTGKVNDDELKYLYKNAKKFAFVSFYEGFGLPPLEAMSYGIPSIVSNVASIPEVVGKCGIKVNPYDYEEIANALISDISIDYKEYYKENLCRFSWKKCADETVEFYNSIV